MGARTYGAHVVTAGSPVREQDLASDEDRQKYCEFWVKMNNELDQFSVAKWTAGELISLHKSRGGQDLLRYQAHPDHVRRVD